VKKSVPNRKLFAFSALGQFIPVLWLAFFGATLATNSASVDPGQIIVDNFGVMAIPVLLLVLHAPIAVNILNIYSFTLSIQCLDLKVNRRILNVLVGVLAWFAVIFFLTVGDFGSTLSSWLSSVAGWAAVWGAIMLVHFYIVERKHSDFSSVLAKPGADKVPLVRWQAMVAFFAGVIMLWACSYGGIPFFMGPIAIALGGVDLSWLGGFITSFTVYFILCQLDKKSYAAKPLSLEEASQEDAESKPSE
jgi:purine-cytosine permease-like protein